MSSPSMEKTALEKTIAAPPIERAAKGRRRVRLAG